jgi:beta-glucosidase
MVAIEVYRDKSKSVADRVADLLARMTTKEKVAQLSGVWVTDLLAGGHFDAEVAAAHMANGVGQVTRISGSTGLEPNEVAELMNDLQRVAVERTRLGIPIVVHEESLGGFCARGATVFPQALALASSWDVQLVEQVAAVIRAQMLAVGARHGLAPVLDVARDPRWGRVEETYGEDPVLVGALGAAYVRGLQGDDLGRGVMATGKHFLGHAISEGGRNHAPAQIGPRELREVYAEPFAAAIRDAGLATIMNSYSSVDGLACAGTRAILTDLLRGELGFDGAVVADYFSVALLISHHRTAVDRGDAATQALNAGLDLELPGTDCFGEPLLEAVAAGNVSPAAIDQAVTRVLTAKFRLGLFESPYVDATSAGSAFDTPEQRSLARRAATEGIILLSNDGVLPLSSDLSSIAVIGPGADDIRLLQGDYHYPAHQEIIYLRDSPQPPVPGTPGTDAETNGVVDEFPGDFLPEGGGAFTPGPHFAPHVTPLAGIRAAVGPETEIYYQKGCDVTGEDLSGVAAATEAAERAAVAVVVVAGRSGLMPTSTVGEARDAVDLRLTGVQEELVAAVAATGTPTVVVVLSGRVHTLDATAAVADALVMSAPPGEEGGAALADILFGAVDPSGRLPVTLPRHVGQVPLYASPRAGGSTAMFYGSYTDSPVTPLFAFGHGLSYTTFRYGHLSIDAGSTRDMTTVRFSVTNSGQRRGTEVAQLYVRDLVASVARVERQLVGFTRVDLDPGESATVTFQVHPSRLAFFDQDLRFVVEPGGFSFGVGRASDDICLLEEVQIGGTVAEYRQREVVATVAEVELMSGVVR